MNDPIQVVKDLQYVSKVFEAVFPNDLLLLLLPDGKGGVDNGAKINLKTRAFNLYKAVRVYAQNKTPENQKKAEDSKRAFSTFLSLCSIDENAEIPTWCQEIIKRGETFEDHYTDTLIAVFEQKVKSTEQHTPTEQGKPRSYLQ